MKLLFIVMFNGFLFSITSSSVHDKKTDPTSPVLQYPLGTKEHPKPTTGITEEKNSPEELKSKPVKPIEDDCPVSHAC